MRTKIPAPVIEVVAEVASSRETHESLDSRFRYAKAPGEPPGGSKRVKALEWLRRINNDEIDDPLSILGKIIECYMETPLSQLDTGEDREKIFKVLAQCKLQYVDGGSVTSALMPLSAPSRTLEKILSTFDYRAVDEEFNRALANVESEPREAVSAASNILESFCKVYIADNGLELPSKQDLKAVWTVVRKHLGFDASLVADRDLQTILTGLLAVVEGIGSLRTHASSAHGSGKTSYRLEPRHSRLAIHSAHTVVLFGLETWAKRRDTAQSKKRVIG